MNRRNRPAAARKHAAPSRAVERIYGVHAVRAALANTRRVISAIHATKNGRDRLADVLGHIAIEPIDVSPSRLTRILGSDAVHQGVMGEAAPLEPPALEAIVERARQGRPIIVLDQITDPHNAGAILRSAAAFNACALVMTRRNSPPLDGALAKAASGAVEHVPVILVANLARALEELGRAGVFRIGLESGADQPLESAAPQNPCALVLGAGHKGLRRLTAKNCDLLCRVTTRGALTSLNVSNAAAIALHTLATRADIQHPKSYR